MIFTIANIEIHLCFHAIISYANISTIKIYDRSYVNLWLKFFFLFVQPDGLCPPLNPYIARYSRFCGFIAVTTI